MRNRRCGYAAPLTPGAAVEDSRDRRQQNIAPIKMCGPFIEVRQPEQHRCDHESCPASHSPLQQVLHPGAKEEFFGHCGEEKYRDTAKACAANSRQVSMQIAEFT